MWYTIPWHPNPSVGTHSAAPERHEALLASAHHLGASGILAKLLEGLLPPSFIFCSESFADIWAFSFTLKCPFFQILWKILENCHSCISSLETDSSDKLGEWWGDGGTCSPFTMWPPCNCEHRIQGIPIMFLEHSSDYCFVWLCCHENSFFYQFENLQLHLIEIWWFFLSLKKTKKQEYATRVNKRWHTSIKTFLCEMRDLKLCLF